MRHRPGSTLAALAAVAALVLAGCGGGGGAGALPGADGLAPGTNDVNPLPRERVREGGDLRWPLDAIPDNFNYQHVDGTTGDNSEIIGALLPGTATTLPDASVVVDTDYFTAVELTSAQPQVVTYTINPAATWSDGTPLTWRDLESQWRALRGTDPAFRATSTTGYEDIASVARGVDDRQAVVTFERVFAEWRSIFNPIYPASTTGDPEVFNTGWIGATPVTAGPFRTEEIDPVGRSVTLVRNEAWWGDRPKLDRIIFRVVDRGALADALANGEIDFYEIGSDVNLFQRARGIPGVAIRQATEPRYNHLTFNGAPGAVLSDPALRRAIATGIDRQAIARALVGQISPDTAPLGNFLFVQGSRDYVDHGIAFDPAAAAAELDRLGWVAPEPGAVRERAGEPLRLRMVVTAANPISERISALARDSLTTLGVEVELVPVPAADLFDQYVTPGNFDLVGFAWGGTVFPVTSTRNIYASTGGQNFGEVGDPEIDALYEQSLRELDDAKRVALGQRIDELLWRTMPQLPLYQGPGAVAVRETLANFGAFGFGSADYADIGYAAG